MSLDETNRAVYRGQNLILLTQREFALLSVFIKNPGNILTREYLISQVWDEKVSNNIVDVYIRYLRNKIDEEGQIGYIQTVRGIGYIMPES